MSSSTTRKHLTQASDKPVALKSWEVTDSAWIAFDAEEHMTNGIQAAYNAGMQDATGAVAADPQPAEGVAELIAEARANVASAAFGATPNQAEKMLRGAVADWIEDPPEWSKFTPPVPAGSAGEATIREAALREAAEVARTFDGYTDWKKEFHPGVYGPKIAAAILALVPEAEGEK